MPENFFSRFDEQKIIRKKDSLNDFSEEDINYSVFKMEEHYKLIFEHGEGIIFTHDITGKILTINPAALRILEYNLEELTGEYIISLLPENQRNDFYDNYLPHIIEHQSIKGVMQIITKSGVKKHWLYHNYYFSNNEKPPFIIGFAQDITDRVKIEEALNISNETFKSIFNFSGIGMMIVDTNGSILDTNIAFCSFSGYSREELLQANFFDLSPNEDNEIDVMYIKKILDKIINYYSIEKRYISKSNKVLWGLHTVSKVSDKNGFPKFFILQVMDITRKKELSDDLNRKNLELETVKADLVAKIQQQEKLNYIIAHNLRGSAGNLRMLIAMLKTAAETDIDPDHEINQVIKYLDEGNTALLNTLNKLMDVVQISVNQTIPYDLCDVAQIINEISKQLNRIIYEKDVTIHLNLKIPTIQYPKVFLESIFYNIISNAVKYSSPDRSPEIIIATYSLHNRTVISIKDNGIGIDLSENGKQLFTPNPHQKSNNKESRGLGLYITKTQIESMGGSISVNSKEGAGTEFVVTL